MENKITQEEKIESNQDMIQRILSEKKGLLLTTDTTFTTFTTLIDSWGYVNLEESVLIEQIDKSNYIYNVQGEIGVEKIQFECKSCGTKIYAPDKAKTRCSCGRILNFKDDAGLLIKNRLFRFKSIPNEPLYLTPSLEDIQGVLANSSKAIDTKELFREIDNFLNTLYEFHNKEDSKICALAILFTYVLPYFNSSFNLGIDATKGSGKTTLLEILTLLLRHGFLADVSPASIPRLKQKYDLNIICDEIDELKNVEDISGLIRRGQRRGNKYVRLNKNTLDEEIYEAFGFYAYSFRSNVEDAFKQRSIMIRTARAKDSRLSIINFEKNRLVKPLFNKIFEWYIKNIFTFSNNLVVSSKSSMDFTHDTNKSREKIYNILTSKFTFEEKNLIKQLFGRNSEIAYLFLQTCKFLDIDLINDIKKLMEEKQSEEETPDTYYFELIKQIFDEVIKNNPEWLLKRGEFAGYRYYPKTNFYMKLVSELKIHNLIGIGMKHYNGLLKDVGFIQGYNIKNQKNKQDMPVPCLIFTNDIIKKLNIDYEPLIIKEEKIE